MFTFLTYNLNNPTKINRLFASVLSSIPANNAFDDENFYELVIDTYNSETGSSKAYTDSLTDSELAQITRIYNEWPSEENKITSLKGIEKLTGLTYLSFSGHNIELVDLSNLTNLTVLELYNNSLSEIDVSNLTDLTTLDLSSNQLSKVDLSDLKELLYLNLEYNNFDEIDLRNNDNLIQFYLQNAYYLKKE